MDPNIRDGPTKVSSSNESHTVSLQLRCPQHAVLLGDVSSDSVHQRRAQSVIRLETDALQLLSDLGSRLGINETLLDSAADKCRKLGLLPAILALALAELNVNEIQSLEGVVLLDAAEEVDTAFLAGVALDGGAAVNDVEFGLIGGDGERITGHDADDAEDCSFRLPALGAAARVVV